jgi:ubiquinone/menaquinone biosynthesis C-methylase UbiE
MCGRWSKVLSTSIYENASSIPVTVCNMPFKDAIIDVISSRPGLINIENNAGTFIEAIDEVYRVLKKGGLFVMMEFVLTNESLQSLTEIHKSILNKKSPSLFEDLVKKNGEALFNLIENIVYNVWSNKEDKSDLADICRHLNIEIKFEEILFIFKK